MTPDQEIAALKNELARVKARYTWAANELLACDYGDNPRGDQVGWLVYGWRDRKSGGERRRIYGPSIDIAIDAELA